VAFGYEVEASLKLQPGLPIQARHSNPAVRSAQRIPLSITNTAGSPTYFWRAPSLQVSSIISPRLLFDWPVGGRSLFWARPRIRYNFAAAAKPRGASEVRYQKESERPPPA